MPYKPYENIQEIYDFLEETTVILQGYHIFKDENFKLVYNHVKYTNILNQRIQDELVKRIYYSK